MRMGQMGMGGKLQVVFPLLLMFWVGLCFISCSMWWLQVPKSAGS